MSGRDAVSPAFEVGFWIFVASGILLLLLRFGDPVGWGHFHSGGDSDSGGPPSGSSEVFRFIVYPFSFLARALWTFFLAALMSATWSSGSISLTAVWASSRAWA